MGRQAQGYNVHGQPVTEWPVHGGLVPVHGGLIPVHGSNNAQNPNIVTDGDGASAATWLPNTGGASSVGGRIRVTGAGVNPDAYQVLAVEAGATYDVTADLFAGTGNPQLRIGEFISDFARLIFSGAGSKVGQFTALDTSVTITLMSVGSATFDEFDNIVIRKV